MPFICHTRSGLSFVLGWRRMEHGVNQALWAHFTEQTRGPEWSGHWSQVKQRDHSPVRDFPCFHSSQPLGVPGQVCVQLPLPEFPVRNQEERRFRALRARSDLWGPTEAKQAARGGENASPSLFGFR